MTRESAKETFTIPTEIRVRHLIDKIYDDFQSRTCKNCKEQSKDEGCPIYYEAYNLHFAEDSKDFGCLKFERKEQ